MTASEIAQAIGEHLAAMDDCPEIVWPNRTTVPASLPYLTFNMAGRRTDDPTLDGSSETVTGRAIVVVVHRLNAYATAAEALAEAVKGRFPRGALGDLFIRQAQVLDGYRTDTDWRVPVVIDWIA